MKQLQRYKVKRVYFKRWSKKKYAAFVSMSLNVIISNLKKGLADASLFKVKRYAERGEVLTYLPIAYDNDAKAPPDLLLLSLLVTENYAPALCPEHGAVALLHSFTENTKERELEIENIMLTDGLYSLKSMARLFLFYGVKLKRWKLKS